MTVRFTSNDSNNPVGKLADAKLHFDDGPASVAAISGRNGVARVSAFPVH
jgi:hypothetical protein